MKLVVFQIALFLGCCSFAMAKGKSDCSKAESIEAEQQAANLKTWVQVQSAFKKFSHCDDGAIAEGFSESVSQLMANKWETVPDLLRLSEADRSFEAFVLRHIDQTAAEENQIKIKDNARNRCPKQSAEFCKKVELALK